MEAKSRSLWVNFRRKRSAKVLGSLAVKERFFSGHFWVSFALKTEAKVVAKVRFCALTRENLSAKEGVFGLLVVILITKLVPSLTVFVSRKLGAIVD